MFHLLSLSCLAHFDQFKLCEPHTY